jgi:LPS export ABC transporter protein LptC
MSKRNSIILGLLFMILVVELIILAPKEIGTGAEPPPAATAPAAAETGSGQIMKDVYSVEAKPEGKEWELWADRALRPKENQEWTIEKVKVKFYASSGVSYTVTGAKGHVVPNEKGIRDIEISGNVITKASNGYVFKSESVFYDSQAKKLASPKEVEMSAPPDKEGGELTLTGSDLKADMNTNEITINKNVRSKKKIKNGKTVAIASERAVFSGRSKIAQFYGNVVVSMDTMTVTGPEARFAYDSKMEALDSILVGGGIKVTDTDKFATSDSVNVSFKDDRIVFKGAPRVVQNGDEMTGDEIVLSENGHKVQVSNAKAQIDSERPKTAEKKAE